MQKKVKVRFKVLELEEQYVRDTYLRAIEKVYKHGRFILGPEVDELEENLCEICDRKYAITVSNGTMALIIALKALSNLYKDRTEVILPAYGWIASANAVKAAGLNVVFADVDDEYFVDSSSVEKLISKKTLAIMSVNFTGRVGTSVWNLKKLSESMRIPILEDAAQSFGAWNSRNRDNSLFMAGSYGLVSCLSINPMKTLSSHGEGGVVLTDDVQIAEFARRYRYQGMEAGEYIGFGINARMETIQAAIVLENLKHYESIIDKKREIADTYNQSLKYYCHVPEIHENELHTFFSYQIRLNKRDQLKNYLVSQGIECQIQHVPLMCDTPIYKDARRSTVLNAMRLSCESLCLPCHEKLSNQQVKFTINCIKKFFGKELYD